jgi:hypothetical protein
VSPADLSESLRQMVAVLQAERQALAGFDLEGILGCAADKRELCGRIDAAAFVAIDEDCRALLDAARRMNEVNRQVRNLIAANVSARLDALTGAGVLYRQPQPVVVRPLRG